MAIKQSDYFEKQFGLNIYNIMLAFFKLSVQAGLTVYNLVDGIMDEFEDESGVATKTNATYNSTDDYYTPEKTTPGWDSYTKLVLHLDNNFTDEIGKTVTNYSVEKISQTTDDTNLGLGDGDNIEYRVAQGFQYASNFICTGIKITFGANGGSPSGNVTARIETDNAGVPSGNLAYANATKVFTPTASAENSVNFDNSFSLTANTTYHLVFNCDNQSQDVSWTIRRNTAGGYADGVASQSTNGVWANIAPNDLKFKIMGYGVTFGNTNPKFSYYGIFNGTSAYCTLADSDDWTFGSGDFTIDCWIYPTLIDNNGKIICGQCDASATASKRQNQLIMGGDGGHHLIMSFWDNTTTRMDSGEGTTTMVINTWYHIAVVRYGNTITGYVNGVANCTIDVTGKTLQDSDQVLGIGQHGYLSATAYFPGFIDEFRISKGIARWTTTFTPPTSAYAADPGTTYNMTLISTTTTAVAQPTKSRIVLFEEDVDSITLNTDLKAYISRDGGTTYTQHTLVNEGNYDTSKRILASESIDISGQPAGTSIKWKVETLNNKDLKLHAVADNWGN